MANESEKIKEYILLKDKVSFIKTADLKTLLSIVDLHFFLDENNEDLMSLETAQIKLNKMFVYSLSEQTRLNLTNNEKRLGFNIFDLMGNGLFIKKEFIAPNQFKNAFKYKLDLLKKIILSKDYLDYLEKNIYDIEKGTQGKRFLNLAKVDNREVFEILFDFIVNLKKNNRENLTKENYEKSYIFKKNGESYFDQDGKFGLKNIFFSLIDEYSNIYLPLFSSDLNKINNSKQKFIKIISDYYISQNNEKLINDLKQFCNNTTITGLQTITLENNKKNNGDQKGNIIPITINENDNRVYLCEGVATGLSIANLINNKNIISCINVKNMEEVAKKYLKTGLDVVICMDLDKPYINNKEIKSGAGTSSCYDLNMFLNEEIDIIKGRLSIIKPIPSIEALNKNKIANISFRDDAFGLTSDGILFKIKDYTGGKFSDFNDLEKYANFSAIGKSIQNIIKEQLCNPDFFDSNDIKNKKLLNYIKTNIDEIILVPFLSMNNELFSKTNKLPLTLDLSEVKNLKDNHIEQIRLSIKNDDFSIEKKNFNPHLYLVIKDILLKEPDINNNEIKERVENILKATESIKKNDIINKIKKIKEQSELQLN